MLFRSLAYIGPDKAGSSWLHTMLDHHPQIYVTEAKDLYFFDRFYHRGQDWYARQFGGALEHHRYIGEVCPDYLACPKAPARMQEVIPQARLVVTLRDPASRAFSSYLYMRKHGEGPPTFREALHSFPALLDHGRYGTQLAHDLQAARGTHVREGEGGERHGHRRRAERRHGGVVAAEEGLGEPRRERPRHHAERHGDCGRDHARSAGRASPRGRLEERSQKGAE